MKNALITIVALALVGGGIYYFISTSSVKEVENPNVVDTTIKDEDNDSDTSMTASSTADMNAGGDMDPMEKETSIGTSVLGNSIAIHHFGEGDTELLFIGGIHGGYSWNTALVAYELIDYLEANPEVIPENVSVSVIPVLNPDGLNTTVGSTGRFETGDVPSSQEATVSGRFNQNEVDLNRNFDCDWQQDAIWQDQSVSGGDEAFSEPESLAIKSYIEKNTPTAVVTWYSSAGGVFASNCHNGPSTATKTLVNVYADASGYTAYEKFNYYEITGDMTNWFAKIDIPAISVLLTTHDDTEWTKNEKGIKALLDFYKE